MSFDTLRGLWSTRLPLDGEEGLVNEDARGSTAAHFDGARESARNERPALKPSPTPGLSLDAADRLLGGLVAAASGLARYHRHRVVHLGRIAGLLERGRRVILVGNHALDVIDPLLLLAEVYRRTGRVPHFIGHEKGWFELPLVRDFSRHFGVIPSRRFEDTVDAVRRDGFLMLYPGGVRESGMRSYQEEPYTLKWEGRTGYLRVALETDADIVFIAALGSEETYYQSKLPTPGAMLRLLGDDRRYEGMRLRFGMAGVHLLPGVLSYPVRLTHVVSEPLDLGDASVRERARRDPAALGELHARLWRDCQQLLDAEVSRRDRHSDPLDQGIRSAQRIFHRLGV